TGNIKGGAEFNAKNMDENFSKILRASEDAMDSFELVGVNVEAAVDANLAADRAEAAAEDAEQSYQNTLAYDQQGEMWKNQAKGYAEDAQGYLGVVESDADRAEDAANAAEASELAAQAARNDAVGAAAAAETSENNAAGSASAAQSYAQSAQSRANAALNHAETAEFYKQDAASSASAASQSASNAAGSAGAAQTARNVAEAHRDKAKEWASNPEDVVVQGGQYSAYHWAKKAEEFVGGPYLLTSNNLSEVDPEEARDNLGLGSAATRDVVSSNADTSGGDKLVTQGWMGLGGQPVGGLPQNWREGTAVLSPSSVAEPFDTYWPTLRIGKGGFTFDLAAKGVRWALRSLHPSDSHQWREIHHTGNFPPIGFCYIQYPGTETPSSLFGGTWTLMFNTEGVFFRTEGQGASSFGSGVQGDAIRNITGTVNYSNSANVSGASGVFSRSGSMDATGK